MLRNYDKLNNNPIKECYRLQRENQTVSFVKYCINKYCTFNRQDNFWKLFDSLSKFVDLSDPDLTLTNEIHLYQTAEGIRKDGLPRWMQFVGLIHDLGKILYLKGCDKDGTSIATQWAIVGDTFITGCEIPKEIVYSEFNKYNKNIYKPNIGLRNVYCSFGHDEYLYRLLTFNKINIPIEGYYMIRYHSLYLWHTNNKYTELEDETDKKMKKSVQLFNKYDLYTKKNTKINKEQMIKMKKYYTDLVKEFIPNEKLFW